MVHLIHNQTLLSANFRHRLSVLPLPNNVLGCCQPSTPTNNHHIPSSTRHQIMLRLLHVAFGLHILIETPASLNFFLEPSEQLQLGTPSPAAEAVVRQYALLIFSSNLIALVFLLRPVDKVSRQVACALGIYHIGPALRAISRLLRREPALGAGLGGPAVHLVVHVLCLIALFTTGLFPWRARSNGR